MKRWETDKRKPARWRPHIETVLDLDLSGYGGQDQGSVGITAVEGVEPVERRNFVGAGALVGVALSAPSASAKGRRLGRTDVQRFRQRVADLRRLDDYAGGSSVFPLAADEINKLSTLAAKSSYSEPIGRALLSTLGELFQFASWTAFDAGRVSQARQLAVTAARAANQAGDRTLAATALSELSYLTASSSTPKEGVAIARASLANAPADVLPVVRVVLADRLAWACARVGDESGVDRALGLSETAHDERDVKAMEEPDTVYWINRDESQIMAGRCWAELRRPRKALPILEDLTAPYDDTHAREVALYECWLAGSYLDAGDIDRAVHAAERAVTLSRSTASRRTDAQIDAMLKGFEPHSDGASVRELLASAR
ncbi:XRE family transcriptional regulator [Streptomyces sp. CY1]|uniref:XRE family transcriptional regulator n=1 Tax=Streptomyces sp. CY1 TaxID=3388313 RepID=UPI00399EF897